MNLREQFEKETGVMSQDGYLGNSLYVEWLENKLTWRTDEPPEEKGIVLKMKGTKEGVFFHLVGSYKKGHYYDDLMYPVKDILCWMEMPE